MGLNTSHIRFFAFLLSATRRLQALTLYDANYDPESSTVIWLQVKRAALSYEVLVFVTCGWEKEMSRLLFSYQSWGTVSSLLREVLLPFIRTNIFEHLLGFKMHLHETLHIQSRDMSDQNNLDKGWIQWIQLLHLLHVIPLSLPWFPVSSPAVQSKKGKNAQNIHEKKIKF